MYQIYQLLRNNIVKQKELMGNHHIKTVVFYKRSYNCTQVNYDNFSYMFDTTN